MSFVQCRHKENSSPQLATVPIAPKMKAMFLLRADVVEIQPLKIRIPLGSLIVIRLVEDPLRRDTIFGSVNMTVDTGVPEQSGSGDAALKLVCHAWLKSLTSHNIENLISRIEGPLIER